jgi:hypothetical protein
MLVFATACLLSVLSVTACDPDDCLPDGIKPSDVVSVQQAKPTGDGDAKTITVAQKLKEIRAHCRRRKLVDPSGKEIRFYHLVGCWGNPPEGYQEILEQQAKDLALLRRRYRVIEMTCNASGRELM